MLIYENDQSLTPKLDLKLFNIKHLKKIKKRKKYLDFSGEYTYYINASSEGVTVGIYQIS